MTSTEIILAPPRSAVRPQVGAVLAAALIAYGWTQLDPDWQRLALTYGWSCLAVVTIGQTVGMFWRLVRPTRGFRP